MSGDAVHICYFTNWARYRTGFMNNQHDVFENDLDATLCTHVNYGFGFIDKDTFALRSNDPNADHPTGSESQTTLCPDICQPGYVHDWSQGGDNPCQWPCAPDRSLRGYEGLNVGMKRKNPNLKSLLSVGGWNFNDCSINAWGQGAPTCEIFSTIASTEANSRQHALHVIQFLRNWGFDGYDLDWEYPVVAGHNDNTGAATPQDYANYIRLLEILQEEFASEAAQSGLPKLLLTAAVGVGQDTVDQAYDIPKMNENLDLISLMTYDIHGTWESITGFNAPLRATAEDIVAYGREVSVEWAVNYWLDRGASPDKLVLGFGTYGRGWKLLDPNQTGPLSPTNGACTAGLSTKDNNGYLAYYEIVAKLEDGTATRFYDADREVPYLVTNNGEWIGYDDVQSFTAKLDFLKSKNLRGAMHWAIDLDDMTTYPMLNTIKDGLVGYRSHVTVSTNSAVPTQVPTVSTTTEVVSAPTVSEGTTETTVVPPTVSDSPTFSTTSVGEPTVNVVTSIPSVSTSRQPGLQNEDADFESASSEIHAAFSVFLVVMLLF